MGVYIHGMEMPENCWSCRMFCNCSACEGYDCHCAALGKDIGTGAKVPRNKRRDDCPLVPVHPHGRLIDADALSAKLNMMLSMAFGEGNTAFHFAYRSLGKVVENAPTIIPAEPFNNLSKPCKEGEA